MNKRTRTEKENTPQQPPAKKKKYLTKYNDNWRIKFPWVRQCDDVHKAFCAVCSFCIDISKGSYKLTDHQNSVRHGANLKNLHSNEVRDICREYEISQDDSQILNKRSLIEASLIYHCVTYSQSYNSLESLGDLLKSLLTSDDVPELTKIIFDGLTLSRRKSTAIVNNVLAKHCIEQVLSELSSNYYFSIETDSSNKQNKKYFPIIVRYFDRTKGLQVKLLNFIQNSNETAQGIYNMLKTELVRMGLPISRVSGFSADNTNSNYGSRNSVFTMLRKDNKFIFKSNCNAHVCNNAVKQMIKSLKKNACNVEELVLKSYAHFSISAVRLASYKSICQDESDKCPDEDIVFDELKKHVVTRWTSLQPAIYRLQKQWKPLRVYFQQLPPSEVDPIITKLMINDQRNTLAYLKLMLIALNMFQEALKHLQYQDTCIIDVHPIISKLKSRLLGWQQSITSSSFTQLSPTEANSCMTNFDIAIRSACEYIDLWAGLSTPDGPFKKRLSKLALVVKEDNGGVTVNVPTASDLSFIASQFNVSVDSALLVWEEHQIRNRIISISPKILNSSTVQGWMYMFSELPNITEYFKVLAYVISLPASSATAERSFSIMKHKARSERSNMSADLLKNEIIIRMNMSHIKSKDFPELFHNNERFLKAIGTDEKYKRNKKEKQSDNRSSQPDGISMTDRNGNSDVVPWRDTGDGGQGELSFHTFEPKGLINEGVNCFINAILQSLFACPPFRKFITSTQDSFSPTFLAFRNLFAEILASRNPTDVSCVYDLWRSFTKRKDVQEDAMEFLDFVINSLHEEMLSGKENSHENSPTPITAIFQSVIRQNINRGRNILTESGFQIHLSIKMGCTKLPDLLKNFFAVEKISEDGISSVTRKSSLEILPEILVLQVGFFNDQNEKIFHDIAYPSKLKITLDMLSKEARNNIPQKQREYNLGAVVYHHGNSFNEGHYTADVNVNTMHNNEHRKKWFHCDDEAIDWVSTEEVLKRGTKSTETGIVPYILFYLRSDTSP